MGSLRLQEMEEAKIEKAKIELFVIQDKIRQTKFQFDSISNHIIHFNDTIKLLNGEKSAFVYAIISYKKTGWQRDFVFDRILQLYFQNEQWNSSKKIQKMTLESKNNCLPCSTSSVPRSSKYLLK